MTTEFLHQSRKSWGQHDLNDIFLDIYIGLAEDASSEKHNDKYGIDLSGLVPVLLALFLVSLDSQYFAV